MNNPFLCAVAASVDSAARVVDITLEDGKVYRCSLSDASERLRLVDSLLLGSGNGSAPKQGCIGRLSTKICLLNILLRTACLAIRLSSMNMLYWNLLRISRKLFVMKAI